MIEIVGGEVSMVLTCWGQLIFPQVPWVQGELQLFALCPFFQHLKQSPSLMQHVCLAGESFFKWTKSISMALGSLVGQKVEEKEERGKPCPLLRAKM